MLDDAQRRERDDLRALVFGPPSEDPVTSAQRARLEELERVAAPDHPASAELPEARIQPDLGPDAPAPLQPAPKRSAGWRASTAAGVLLAAAAFVCGLALGPELDPTVVAASTGSADDVDTPRSFARVSAYVAWDQPSLLGVAKYGNDVTAWTGRVADGVLDCAAFDDGSQVVVQCLRTAANPLPHSFTWTKESGPDPGEYNVRVGRGGSVEGWFESARSALR
jgi:hypothetical protein